jgi:shikimate dehydrogenase
VTIKAGVLGYPARHSLSPALHGAWLAARGIDGTYEAVEVAPADFARAVRARFEDGWAGFNVTMPHKRAAFEFADERTATAQALGVSNLIFARDGKIVADNRDGEGFLYGLRRQAPGLGLRGAEVLILGAGGAAQAVAQAVAQQGARVIVANRSEEKARALAGSVGGDVMSFPPPKAALAKAALIVNATSVGMAGGPAVPDGLDFAQAAPGAVFYDLIYKPLETPLILRAKAAGLKIVDGLDMLIGQARPAFQTLYGAPPPDDVDVRAILLARIAAAAKT